MAMVLLVLALTGGFSRYDTAGLVLLRLVLVLAAGVMAILPAATEDRITRLPLLLTGLLALVIVLQLVPLPPAVWLSLPQRARYGVAAALAKQSQPWRPISIVPVLTLNALLALLPAAVVLFGFGRLSVAQQRLGVVALLVLATASATLGILQLGAGPNSWAYLYSKVSEGLPGGLFANRNHQAAFLAGSLPFFVTWALHDGGATRGRQRASGMFRTALAVAGALLALLVILATGSRSGLVLALANAVGATYLVLAARGIRTSRQTVRILAGIGGAGAAVVGLAIWFGRGSGFARFQAIGERGAEMRILAWPVLKQLAVDYLPWGSGFGTFNPLFRIFEPDALLKPTYFNAAHNDLIELVITGGVPALLVLAGFLVWFAWRCAIVFRSGARPAGDVLVAQAAAMLLLTFLLASLSDYPLRTPLAGGLVALAAGLIERGVRAVRGDRATALVRDGAVG
jgi:O-antigen ligase